jgi:nickel-type superoxide dismutase maturation protease
MGPTLHSGDWLLVDPDAFSRRAPTGGDLVVVPHPRRPERLIVKRVATVAPSGGLVLLGDAPEASTDSRSWGPVPPTAVIGRPWFRYWPLRRVGRVR